MGVPAVKARLNFLAASAHLYSSAAPATSAHLMLECKHIATTNDILVRETESKHACNACGSIFVPGWTVRTTIVDSRRHKNSKSTTRRKGHSIPRAAEKLVLSECLVCHRSKTTPLMSSARQNLSGKKITKSRCDSSATFLRAAAESGTAESQTQGTERPSTNINSKKRAKSRKQGGLKAMLDKSKAIEASSSGTGLDLMDIMMEA